jgi:hypothetical protein
MLVQNQKDVVFISLPKIEIFMNHLAVTLYEVLIFKWRVFFTKSTHAFVFFWLFLTSYKASLWIDFEKWRFLWGQVKCCVVRRLGRARFSMLGFRLLDWQESVRSLWLVKIVIFWILLGLLMVLWIFEKASLHLMQLN